nr:MAG TPA: hypothetical protein [Caudoviricetes sp.]
MFKVQVYIHHILLLINYCQYSICGTSIPPII